MRINNILSSIEEDYDVKILLAVEAGSRAMGFDSPDSDYDVRFIYIRPRYEYLKLQGKDDTIVTHTSDELIDLHGWDIDKALRLIHKGNPTACEWMSCDTIYLESELSKDMHLRSFILTHFYSKPAFYHYLNKAKRNYEKFLSDPKSVSIKKYFYVFHSLMSAYHVLASNSPPPVSFKSLMDQYLIDKMGIKSCAYVHNMLDELLESRKYQVEMEMIPPVVALNNFIIESLDKLEHTFSHVVDLISPSWEHWKEFNDFFYTLIGSEENNE
jgi:predicted nucleotidyltransferase